MAKAWRQTVRWLVADVPRQIELGVRRRQNSLGAPAELRVAVRDPEYKPMDNASVSLLVTAPDGSDRELRPEPSSGEAGTYLVSYVPRQPGAYRAKAIVTAADGSDVGSHEVGWTSDPASEEFRRLQPDLALLQRIAEQTGGQLVAAERLEQFIVDLPNRKMPITDPWISPLWHRPLVFLLAIVCLTAEWGLRRFKGLP